MSSFTNPRLRVEVARGRTRVTFLGGRLDAGDVAALGEQLTAAPSRPRLRLDLTRVEFLSAATLAGLLGLRQSVRAARGELAIENVGPLVYEVFEATGLTDLLDVHASGAGAPVRAAV
jgi:anti-anti-sigma factor